MCVFMSRLPGSASRTHVESLGKPRDSTSALEALPDKQKTRTWYLFTLQTSDYGVIIDVRGDLMSLTMSLKRGTS